jgi:pimeloyl-[acyl-carrier protein] methyl ester esterase
MDKLFTLAAGAGDPQLVLIHGWTCDHRAMAPVAAAFPDHRSTLVDLLGHGRSPRSGDYSIEAQAAAVLAVAPARAVYVGHSMGAQVAIAAAVAAPERVSALVLLDPAFIAPHDKAVAFGEGMRNQLSRVDIPAMIEVFGRNQIVSATDMAAVEELVAVMKANDPAVTRAAWDAVLEWDGAAAIAKVACPVLLIAIDKPLNRPADVARLNPRVTTGQVAGSGHMVQFEVMDQVAAMIRRFLHLERAVIGG